MNAAVMSLPSMHIQLNASPGHHGGGPRLAGALPVDPSRQQERLSCWWHTQRMVQSYGK